MTNEMISENGDYRFYKNSFTSSLTKQFNDYNEHGFKLLNDIVVVCYENTNNKFDRGYIICDEVTRKPLIEANDCVVLELLWKNYLFEKEEEMNILNMAKEKRKKK